MRYFSNFPQTLYQVSPASFRKEADYVSMVDITRNFRFKKEVIDNISMYDVMSIQEGDSIETVSERLYGSPHFHWVLMLLNDRYDYIKDLPLSATDIEDYLNSKYPAAYIDSEYGTDMRGIYVDIQDTNNISIDLDATVRILDRDTGAFIETRPVISTQYHDSTLNTKIKSFHFKDTGVKLDSKLYRIDQGAISDLTFISLDIAEININDQKRIIKIIDKNLLSYVLQNFKDMM